MNRERQTTRRQALMALAGLRHLMQLNIPVKKEELKAYRLLKGALEQAIEPLKSLSGSELEEKANEQITLTLPQVNLPSSLPLNEAVMELVALLEGED